MISLKDNNGVYSGTITLNDCKPDKKGKPSKVQKVLPIAKMMLSNGDNDLTIVVSGKKGPITLAITYQLKRVSAADLKLNKN